MHCAAATPFNPKHTLVYMTVGILKRFARGQFGFFAVEGEPDVFVHSNQFVPAGIEPVVGERYEFDISHGVDGRARARGIRAVTAE